VPRVGGGIDDETGEELTLHARCRRPRLLVRRPSVRGMHVSASRDPATNGEGGAEMSLRVRWSTGVVAGLAMLAMAGCQTMTGRTAGRYADDGKITTEVKAKLAADRLSNLTRVGVTTTNGVVYLTGVVDSPDRAARAVQIAQTVPGVRQVVDEMQVAQAPPPPTASAAPPPPPAAAAPPGHPRVDVSGTVASYDPATGILTLTDGRAVRVSGATVFQPAPAQPGAIQPGAQVIVHDAEPVAMAPGAVSAAPAAAPPPAGAWRLGTVSRVDITSGLLYLTDGTVVHVGSSPIVQLNTNQPVPLAQLRPGTQVAISAPSAPSASPATAAPYAGSALPRQTPPPAETTEIIIFPAR
jgi:hypothetical protein